LEERGSKGGRGKAGLPDTSAVQWMLKGEGDDVEGGFRKKKGGRFEKKGGENSLMNGHRRQWLGPEGGGPITERDKQQNMGHHKVDGEDEVS